MTRHMKQRLPEAFSGFCSVSAVKPGVLGTSGMEALELVRAAADFLQPEAIIALDALAAMDPARLCTTVQLTDAGLAPGSGIGNHRAAFTKQALGRPVLAVGAPTLMRAQSLAERELPGLPGLIVTPRDADVRVRELARVVGFGLTLALHPGLSVHNVRLCYVNKIMRRRYKLPGKVPVDKNVDNVKNFAVQGEIHISTLLSTPFVPSHLRRKSYKLVTRREITSTAQLDYRQLFCLKKC